MTEFADTAVPAEHRQPAWKILLVSVGLTAVVINMIVGGVLGAAMPAGGWVSAILVGGGVLALVAAYTAFYSHRTGRSFALQTVEIFGSTGSRVVAGFVGLIILGWYAIQASLLGHAISEYLGTASAVEYGLLFCVPLVLATTAFAGFRGLAHLSAVAVPAILVLSVVALVRPAGGVPMSSGSSIPWPAALTMVIALWIMGAVATIGDVARYARTSQAAVASAVVAFLVGNTGLMLAGAWAANRFGAADLSEVLRATGLPGLGLLLLVANIWTTNDNAIYSVGLNWAHATRIRYRNLILLAALVSAVVSLFRPYESQVLSAWLTSLGAVVPALGGVIIGRRFGAVQAHPGTTWVTLTIGVAVALIDPFALGPLLGLATAAIAQALIERSSFARSTKSGNR